MTENQTETIEHTQELFWRDPKISPSTHFVPETTQQHQLPALEADDKFIVDINHAILSGAIQEERVHSLLNIKQRIIDQRNKEAFYEAFSLMQAKIAPIVRDSQAGKDSQNSNYKFDYASGDAIMSEIGPLLGEFGFFLTHKIEQPGNSQLKVFSRLVHRKGHEISTEMTLPYDASGGKNSVQAVGSTQTYGMKYNIIALLSLAMKNSDDDGAKGGATPTPKNQQRPTPVQAARGPTLNEAQVEALDQACNECGIKARTEILGWMQVQSLADIREVDYEKVKKGLLTFAQKNGINLKFGA